MELQQFISPCHFGMEAILKREIYDLGYDIVKVEDGRVTYEGDMETICRANIHFADNGACTFKGWRVPCRDF